MGSHSSSSTTITRPALTDETIPLTSLRDCVRESEFDLNPETMHAFDFPRSGSSSSGTEEKDGGGRERTFGIRVTCEEVATKKTIFFAYWGVTCSDQNAAIALLWAWNATCLVLYGRFEYCWHFWQQQQQSMRPPPPVEEGNDIEGGSIDTYLRTVRRISIDVGLLSLLLIP